MAALAGAIGNDKAEPGRKHSSRTMNLPDGGGRPGIQLPKPSLWADDGGPTARSPVNEQLVKEQMTGS